MHIKTVLVCQWAYLHHYNYLSELFIEMEPCDLYFCMQNSHGFSPEGHSGE